MPYSLSPKKVEKYLTLLDGIRTAVAKGEEYDIEFESGTKPNTVCYRVNEVLACAELYKEYGYEELREMVHVSVNTKRGCITVRATKDVQDGVVEARSRSGAKTPEMLMRKVNEMTYDLSAPPQVMEMVYVDGDKWTFQRIVAETSRVSNGMWVVMAGADGFDHYEGMPEGTWSVVLERTRKPRVREDHKSVFAILDKAGYGAAKPGAAELGEDS